MNFGDALVLLKNGAKVSREGWNGKGMYIFLSEGHPVDEYMIPAAPPTGNSQVGGVEPKQKPFNQPGQMLSHIVMKTAGDSKSFGEGCSDYVPWLASQTDILADDWTLVSIV